MANKNTRTNPKRVAAVKKYTGGSTRSAKAAILESRAARKTAKSDAIKSKTGGSTARSNRLEQGARAATNKARNLNFKDMVTKNEKADGTYVRSAKPGSKTTAVSRKKVTAVKKYTGMSRTAAKSTVLDQRSDRMSAKVERLKTKDAALASKAASAKPDSAKAKAIAAKRSTVGTKAYKTAVKAAQTKKKARSLAFKDMTRNVKRGKTGFTG